MGKGRNKRQRLKLVKQANEGNLLKASVRQLMQQAVVLCLRSGLMSVGACMPCSLCAQFGKATAHKPLPKAPTKEDQVDKVPSSLKRFIEFKVCRVVEQAPACLLPS